MQWDAIGAMSEMLGAIAVVTTLLYLTREVRQNARSMSIAALRDTTAQWNQWSEMLATSADLADIVARGNVDYGGLEAREKLRYGAYVQSFFDNVESYRSLAVDHGMDKDMDVLSRIVGRRVTIPGYRSWWRENVDDYAGDFVAWVDEIARRRELEDG